MCRNHRRLWAFYGRRPLRPHRRRWRRGQHRHKRCIAVRAFSGAGRVCVGRPLPARHRRCHCRGCLRKRFHKCLIIYCYASVVYVSVVRHVEWLLTAAVLDAAAATAAVGRSLPATPAGLGPFSCPPTLAGAARATFAAPAERAAPAAADFAPPCKHTKPKQHSE